MTENERKEIEKDLKKIIHLAERRDYPHNLSMKEMAKIANEALLKVLLSACTDENRHEYIDDGGPVGKEII